MLDIKFRLGVSSAGHYEWSFSVCVTLMNISGPRLFIILYCQLCSQNCINGKSKNPLYFYSNRLRNGSDLLSVCDHVGLSKFLLSLYFEFPVFHIIFLPPHLAILVSLLSFTINIIKPGQILYAALSRSWRHVKFIDRWRFSVTNYSYFNLHYVPYDMHRRWCRKLNILMSICVDETYFKKTS